MIEVFKRACGLLEEDRSLISQHTYFQHTYFQHTYFQHTYSQHTYFSPFVSFLKAARLCEEIEREVQGEDEGKKIKESAKEDGGKQTKESAIERKRESAKEDGGKKTKESAIERKRESAIDSAAETCGPANPSAERAILRLLSKMLLQTGGIVDECMREHNAIRWEGRKE